MSGEPERLPPPPFWRTRYFALDVLLRRDYLDPLEIMRVIRAPDRREVQNDGRIRLWGYSAGPRGYLRVVLYPTARPCTTPSSMRTTN